jgi:hypothetical protein
MSEGAGCGHCHGLTIPTLYFEGHPGLPGQLIMPISTWENHGSYRVSRSQDRDLLHAAADRNEA